MTSTRYDYSSLDELLGNVSPCDLYRLLDKVCYYTVLAAEHHNEVMGLGDNFLTLCQVRDVFGQLAKQVA